MEHTFDKLKINELIKLYERLLVKLNDYSPDTRDYFIIEEKLKNIESIIQDKKPNYFLNQEQKKDIAFLDNIYTDKYEIKYAAIVLGVSRQTIYNWIKQKKINVIKIGRKPYITKTEMDEIAKDGTK